MGRIEKTVFIGYRRADEPWALAVFGNLTQHGYDVFIDYDGIASGNFETAILENIKARAHFLVLLTPTALERCGDPKDWMRREIEAALDNRRNIVPLMLEGFDFRAPAIASQLTDKLALLKEYNGIPIPAGFFQEAMERLRNRFLNVPFDAVLHSASVPAQQVATEQKDKAAHALADEQHKREEKKPLQAAQAINDLGRSPGARLKLWGITIGGTFYGFISAVIAKPLVTFVGLFAITIVGFGGYLVIPHIKPLFQAPPRGGAAAPAPTVSDSVITLVAMLPYTALEQAADTKIPASVPVSGDGHVACMNVPYVNPGNVGSHQECVDKPYLDFRGAGTEKVCVNVPDITAPSIGTRNQCADYHWNADVTKDGPVQIGKSGADIRVSQSIHVTGSAGLRGDLARALSLSGKSFDVRVASAMNLSASLNNQWCPVMRVTPVGRWVESASVEVVGRNCVGIDLGALGQPELCAGPANLGLADALNGEFDKHRDDLQRAAQNILPCDELRAKIGEQWHPFSIKIDRPGQVPLFLNIDPKTAGFSELIAEDAGIKLVLRVGAKIVLSTTELATTGGTLPPLDTASAAGGSLDVTLQAGAPYDFLKNELAAALKGKTFTKDTGAGAVEVRIDDVDLYYLR
jgi:Domain of unknown function (DUF4403)/TIR domain